MKHDFGERQSEYSSKLGKDIPVFVTPKYNEAKEKAISAIESGSYGLQDSDFWILMNQTKNDKMAYTSLIISHNGCLKINDKLQDKFDPNSVTVDKDGYSGALVYTYSNGEQGVYDVGEVSKANCTNAYPYAMAFKRCFDRVVLKLSKLAYSGIMSDSESEEFARVVDAPKSAITEEENPEPATPLKCSACGKEIKEEISKDGSKTFSPSEVAGRCKGMCKACYEASKSK